MPPSSRSGRKKVAPKKKPIRSSSVSPTPIGLGTESRRPEVSAPSASVVTRPIDRHYITSDLKKIGIIGVSMLVILIVLSIIL